MKNSKVSVLNYLKGQNVHMISILSERKKSIPILLSIYIFCLFTIHGFGVLQHLVYNLSYFYSLPGKQITSSFYSITSNIFSFKYIYPNIIVPYLTNASLYIVLAALIKALLVLMVYLIVSKMLNRQLSILVTILFTYTATCVTHGVIANGIWGEAIFVPASLSALFSLLFIYLWLRGNYIFAFIMAGIAVQFHALYGIGALVFMFLGGMYAIETSEHKQKAIAKNIIGIFVFLSFVGYALIMDYAGLELNAVSGLAIQDWYRFRRLTDPTETLLSYSILNYGYGFFTLIIAGSAFSWRRKDKQSFDYFTIGALVTLVFFLTIEVFHYYGIFFGKLSELFIGLQLRRGVWIAAFFGLISIVSEFAYNEKKNNNYVVATFIVTMFFPTLLTFTFLILLFCILFYRSDKHVVILIGAAYIFLAVSAILSRGTIVSSREIMSLLPLAVVLMSVFAVKNVPRIASFNVVSMSVAICLLLAIANSIKIDRFTESVKLLTNADLSVPQGRRDFIVQIDQPEKIYDESLARFLESKENSQKHALLQIPLVHTTYFSELYYNSPFLVNNSNPHPYSNKLFERWIDNLSLFWDRRVLLTFIESGRFNLQSFSGEFDKRFEAAGRVELSMAKTKQGLRYYVISKKRTDLSDLFVFKGNHYYVYDLEKLP